MGAEWIPQLIRKILYHQIKKLKHSKMDFVNLTVQLLTRNSVTTCIRRCHVIHLTQKTLEARKEGEV